MTEFGDQNQANLTPSFSSLSGTITTSFEDALSRLTDLTESYRYKSIFNRYLEKDIQMAENGDNRSLFRLIKFDKMNMFRLWAMKRIRDKAFKHDEAFFDNLSSAIKSKLAWKRVKRKRHQDLADAIKKVYPNYVALKRKGQPERFRKALYRLYSRYADQDKRYENDPTWSVISSNDAFNTFLRRYFPEVKADRKAVKEEHPPPYKEKSSPVQIESEEF